MLVNCDLEEVEDGSGTGEVANSKSGNASRCGLGGWDIVCEEPPRGPWVDLLGIIALTV